MSQHPLHFPSQLNGQQLRIAIVASRFNAHIVEPMQKSCIQTLLDLGVQEDQLDTFSVPGALEIPITLAWLANKDYDALIALGCIIRGETYHFEIVANESSQAITRLSQDYLIPIINGILTTENETQAVERIEKSIDYAKSAVEMGRLKILLTETDCE